MIVLTNTVNQGTTSWYKAVFRDDSDVLVDDTNISTMTMTLYDKTLGTIINTKDDYDVRNSGNWGRNVTIDNTATKNLICRLDPADNAIVSTTLIDGETEAHILLLEGTTSGTPSQTFKIEVEFKVKNVTKVS